MSKYLSILLCIAICSAGAVFAQNFGTPFFRHYDYKDIQTSPALTSPMMWDATQDAVGNLYFANNEGVVCFDGKNWRLTITPKPVRGLTYDKVSKRIYVSCKGDLGYLMPNDVGLLSYKSLRPKVARDHLVMNDLEKVYAAQDAIYFLSENRLYQIPRSKPNTVNVERTDSISGSCLVGGHLFVNFRNKGLKKVAHGSAMDIPATETFKNNLTSFLGEASPTEAYISNDEGKIYKLSSAGVANAIPNQLESFFKEVSIYDGSVLKSGNIVVGTYSAGAIILNSSGNKVFEFSEASGFPSNNIFSIFTDAEGGLWIGHGEGLSYLQPDLPLVSFQNLKGLQGKIKSIINFKDKIYVATVNGVFTLEANQFNAIPNLQFECWDLKECAGRLLLATSEGCYDITDGKKLLIKDLIVLKIVPSNADKNIVYVGTFNGVYRLKWKPEINDWENLGRISGVIEEIISISEINANEVWLGTSFEGLLRVNFSSSKPTIQRFNALNNFVDGKVIIYKIGNENVFATNNGYYKFDGKKFILNEELSKSFKDASVLIENGTGANGLEKYWRIPTSGILAVDAKNISQIDSHSIANIIDLAPTYLYATDKGIWVAYTNELAFLDGTYKEKWNKPFNIGIRSVKLNEDSIHFDGYYKVGDGGIDFEQKEAPSFSYKFNTLTFEVGATSFLNPNGNMYQYWLEGLGNSDWGSWSKNNIISFSNLAEGSYTLHIRAKNALNIYSPETVYSFTISPPWYRTKIAYLAYILLAGLIGYVGVKGYTAKIVADNKRLENQISQRTQEVNDKNSALEKQTSELQSKNSQLENAYQELKENKDQIELQQNLLVTNANELQEKNKDLEQAYEELKATKEQIEQQQTQIIQSEKLAALGQLIAGVAHEINTPLGAINGASKDLSDSLPEMLKKMPAFYKHLSADLEPLFFKLVDRTLEKAPVLSSREERQLKKDLTTSLENLGVGDEASNIARELVRIGAYTNIEEFTPIFLNANSTEMIDMASNIGWTRVNLANITLAVQKTQKIVFALKSYARQSATEEAIDLNIVENLDVVLTIYHNQIKNDVNLVTNYEPNLPIVKGYPDELNQVWTNLLHNSLQAMQNKGEIKIEAFSTPEHVIVTFTDSGSGIPEHVLPRIFEAFYTTKAQGEGSGLGLSICKKIIEKHNGEISVESEPGKTTFTVKLPLNI